MKLYPRLGVQKIWFFPRIFQYFATSTSPPSTGLLILAIDLVLYLHNMGRSEHDQPIGVNEHLHCAENCEDILQQYVGEGWVVAVDMEKTIFPELPVFLGCSCKKRYKK